MKRFSVILLSAVFAFALYSCGDDDPVYEEYKEYPGDLAALGFKGPMEYYLYKMRKMKPNDDLTTHYEYEELFLRFDTDGNLIKLAFQCNKSHILNYPPFLLCDTPEEKSGIYEYPERDQMGRVTLRNTLNDSGNTVATTSYSYDDDKRKCQMELKEEGNDEIKTYRLDKYGYYGSLFSVDFRNRDMLTRFLEYLPNERPEDGEFGGGWYDFQENGYHYMIKSSCHYY